MATYGEVTRRITSELRADRAFDAATLKDAVYDSMRDIAKRCIPLSLISQGNADPLFRWIDNVSFIRKMAVPSGVLTDTIDIDDLLQEAVVWGACKILTASKKADYHTLMMGAINDYQWDIYEGETNVVFDEGCEA